jgi:hypothetical protein
MIRRNRSAPLPRVFAVRGEVPRYDAVLSAGGNAVPIRAIQIDPHSSA